MKEARTKQEIAYVLKQIQPPLNAIARDNPLKAAFLGFAARKTGVDPVLFSIRLYSSLKKGILPTAVTCVLLLDFWQNARSKKRPQHTAAASKRRRTRSR